METITKPFGEFFSRHPKIMAFIDKYMKDNVGMLASVVAWALLTSMVPILVGLIAISGLFLRDPATQQSVITHLHSALQGALTLQDIQSLVKLSVQHTGLLGVIGFAGILWGGSNVGGAISTAFQPIFQVRGRDFIKEKLLDVGMIFVLTALMVVIIAGTTAVSVLNRLLTGSLPGIVSFAIGTAISLLAAFLLFATIYLTFPNTAPRFKLGTVWSGAAIAAVLFQILTFIWPIYAGFSHFSKYTAVLASLLVLTAWLYFFSMVLLIGAEFVSMGALAEAKAEGRAVGPAPDGTVPQRTDTEAVPDTSSKVSAAS